MPTRDELIEHLWQDIINPHDDPSTLEHIVAHCRRKPDAPFADAGPAIERALARPECLPRIFV